MSHVAARACALVFLCVINCLKPQCKVLICIKVSAMAGLVKAKKYDWKDSNLALFGSDTERQVRWMEYVSRLLHEIFPRVRSKKAPLKLRKRGKALENVSDFRFGVLLNSRFDEYESSGSVVDLMYPAELNCRSLHGRRKSTENSITETRI